GRGDCHELHRPVPAQLPDPYRPEKAEARVMLVRGTGDAVRRASGRLRGSLWRALAFALALALTSASPVAAERPATSDAEMAYYAIHAMPEVQAQHDEALNWLAEHADKRAVAALVHLMRWQPDDVPTLHKLLQKITGDDAGEKWFDWMVWLQEHPEYEPYAG